MPKENQPQRYVCEPLKLSQRKQVSDGEEAFPDHKKYNESHSSTKNSMTWFWYTVVIAIFKDSVSGHNSVGPNTMAMFWECMRFFEL